MRLRILRETLAVPDIAARIDYSSKGTPLPLSSSAKSSPMARSTETGSNFGHSVPQTGKGVMRRRRFSYRRHAGGLRATVSQGRGNQKLDVVVFSAFGPIHPPTLIHASANGVTPI
jgi:hypothetical protein